jgi:hypothetical protein
MPSHLDDAYWREYHVTPRYLAGSSFEGTLAFHPFRDLNWPQYHDDLGGFHVSSPDQRLRIGYFGDDYILWKIAAYADPYSAPQWAATFNHNTPTEIVAGLTATLADDYQAGTDRFLGPAPLYWAEGASPLTEAGWAHGAAERGTVEIVAADGQAGLFLDRRLQDPQDESWTLWAGPKGWGTRWEGTFTTRTPTRLIAATATAMADPAPVVRCEHMIARECRDLVRLTPVQPPPPPVPPRPTPLDARRTAVTQALRRAADTRHPDSRAVAALARTTTGLRGTTPSSAATPSPQGLPPAAPSRNGRRS